MQNKRQNFYAPKSVLVQVGNSGQGYRVDSVRQAVKTHTQFRQRIAAMKK